MRILLVEDDDRIAKPLAEDLRHQHHVVDWSEDGIVGLECARSAEYDLVLLDLMLPKLDGIRLCKQLRQDGYTGFIVMLTAKDSLTDKVIGLDAGADDYLVKPFELEELSARIRALSRRPVALQHLTIHHELLTLDSALHTIAYAGQMLSLTPKEYLILECLIRNPQQVFTRSALLDRLWEFDQISREETVKTHITNIRRKLKHAGCSYEVIETVYGVGYRLCNVDPNGE